MSYLEPVNPTEVLLTLENRASEALAAFNAEHSLTIPQQFDNQIFEVPDNGGTYVSFTVNFGATPETMSVDGASRQAGICVLKTHTKIGSKRLLPMEIQNTYAKYFDYTTFANNSLMITRVAPGTEAGPEGQYWTEKMIIYFNYMKKGML